MAQAARQTPGVPGRYGLSVGCGVALSLVASIAGADSTKAQCARAEADGQAFVREGKRAEARAQFEACGDAGCPEGVRKECAQGLSELESAQTAGGGGSTEMSTGKVFGLAMGAVGAAGVIAGSVFGVLTFSSVSAQKADCASSASCPNPARAESDHTTAATDGTLSTFSFIAGGALLAAGAVFFFASPSAPQASSSGVTVYPTIGLGGVSVRGSF